MDYATEAFICLIIVNFIRDVEDFGLDSFYENFVELLVDSLVKLT